MPLLIKQASLCHGKGAVAARTALAGFEFPRQEPGAFCTGAGDSSVHSGNLPAIDPTVLVSESGDQNHW